MRRKSNATDRRAMSQIITTGKTEAGIIERSWFEGMTLRTAEYSQPTIWGFAFSSGARIAVECLWRLIGPQGILLTSDDHGHKFGLTAPVDAQHELLAHVGDATVSSFRLRDITLDLSFTFSNSVTLEILPTSSGYEAWQITCAHQHVIAQGGGQLCTYNDSL